MSLEYYLCCRKNYYEIISNLDSILEAYDTIYCIAECEDLIHEYIKKNREKEMFCRFYISCSIQPLPLQLLH